MATPGPLVVAAAGGVDEMRRVLSEARRLVAAGAFAVRCPVCLSRPGWRCTRNGGRGKMRRPHPQRLEAHSVALKAVLGIEEKEAAA